MSLTPNQMYLGWSVHAHCGYLPSADHLTKLASTFSIRFTHTRGQIFLAVIFSTLFQKFTSNWKMKSQMHDLRYFPFAGQQHEASKLKEQFTYVAKIAASLLLAWYQVWNSATGRMIPTVGREGEQDLEKWKWDDYLWQVPEVKIWHSGWVVVSLGAIVM